MKNRERIERLEKAVNQLEQRLTSSWAQVEYKHSDPKPLQKTVRQWLEELPDGYRERALSQMVEEKAHIVCESMRVSLFVFTYWPKTNEGHDFWAAVRIHYQKGTPLPPLPAEHYEAGFWWNSVDNLNLPDGSSIYLGIASKTWHKFSSGVERPSKPHTLTEVTEYTVGKFYYLGGDKNNCERYALCVKIDSEVSLVIPRNVSGIVVMGIVSASQDDDTIFEVTPVK